ncbi:hypothetical protein [Hydrogenobacter thermophilus]|nr:hypothetical protein [Hydrogenobacter thermophilus]
MRTQKNKKKEKGNKESPSVKRTWAVKFTYAFSISEFSGDMNFFRLNVIVHIVGEEQLLRTFKGALERPSVFLSLGGGEYPALVKNKLHRKGDIPS